MVDIVAFLHFERDHAGIRLVWDERLISVDPQTRTRSGPMGTVGLSANCRQAPRRVPSLAGRCAFEMAEFFDRRTLVSA